MSRLFAAAVLLFAGASLVAADVPNWARLGKADRFLQEQQLTQAISLFQQILDDEGTMPEALHGLGKAYLGSGDVQLAERELKNALAQRQHLYTPQEQYEIKYSLSDVYYITAQQRALQDILLSITDDDSYFTEREHQDARRNYRRVLQQQGLDELFQLYRLPHTFSRRAHRELGMQFLLQNLPSQAVDHLIFAVLMGFSEVIEEMLRIFPNYRYESVLQTYDDIFTEDPRTRHLREYLRGDSFTAELLYLADAFYIEGQTALANELWRIIVQIPGPDIFRDRARLQLQQPSLPEQFILRVIDKGLK